MTIYYCENCDSDKDDVDCPSYEYPIGHLDGPFYLVCENCHDERINKLHSGE